MSKCKMKCYQCIYAIYNTKRDLYECNFDRTYSEHEHPCHCPDELRATLAEQCYLAGVTGDMIEKRRRRWKSK
jgi:hypothetical protein